jgi:hypothetical protein
MMRLFTPLRSAIALALALGTTACAPAPEPEPPAEEGTPPELRVRVTPSSVALPPGGQVRLMAEVVDLQDQVVFNREDAPLTVLWRSTDPEAATVDDYGLVTVRDADRVNIEVYLVEDGADGDGYLTEEELIEARRQDRLPEGSASVEVNPDDEAPFTDLAAVWIAPERVAMDIGEVRTLAVTAVDEMGAPTTLDCGEEPALTFSDYVDVGYTATTGAESLSVTGVSKGFSLVSLSCAGFAASPVIVEVKPSVTLPDPSPSAQDSDFGLQPSLALNGDHIHLTTYDQQHQKLVYTHFDGTWHSQFLDGEGDYGRFSKVVLDPLHGNRPLVCAWEGDAVTCWLQDEEGFWLRRVVDAQATLDVVERTPLRAAVDPEGTVHLLYHRARMSEVVLASSRDPGRSQWNLQTVAPSADHAALALASDGRLRVAIRQGDRARFGHRDCQGPGWIFEDIDVLDDIPPIGEEPPQPAPAPPGTYIQMVIGTDDRPQVVYYKAGNLVHAVRSNGEWRSGVIESVALGGPSIGLDLDRRRAPRVSYFDETAERMRYASRKQGQWHIDSPTAETGIGRDSALVVDAFDRAQIAYYDDSAQEAGFYVEPHFLDYGAVDRGTPDPGQALIGDCAPMQ